jgi:hypothetical protein
VLPSQLQIKIEFFDGGISIDQSGGADGDQSLWVAGRANLDLLISALQKARETMQ